MQYLWIIEKSIRQLIDNEKKRNWKGHTKQLQVKINKVFWPMEQSAPVQLASQTQVPESVLKVPWLEHCSGQVLFRISQLIPPQPGLQWHSPWWQAPWPEHIGSTQSTEDTHRGWQQCQLATSTQDIKPTYLAQPLWLRDQPKSFSEWVEVAPVPDDGRWAAAETV